MKDEFIIIKPPKGDNGRGAGHPKWQDANKY
jgi:hypothetical protein